MLLRDAYFKRVMILGQYCYHDRAEDAVRLVFSCLKEEMPEDGVEEMLRLLPEPVRQIWDETDYNDISVEGITNCVAMAKERGGFPYRAAAERAFEVVFASIGEVVDAGKKKRILEILPVPVRVVFERSRSCILDGSAEDFL